MSICGNQVGFFFHNDQILFIYLLSDLLSSLDGNIAQFIGYDIYYCITNILFM